MPVRFSHSALNAFKRCPRQFQFKYIDHVSVPRRVTANIYLGEAIHRVLQEIYKAAHYDRVLPLERVIELYDAEWEKPEKKNIIVLNENMAVDDYIASGRKMLREYYARYQPFDQGKTMGLEQHLKYELPETPFRFTARIDRLWDRGEGVVEIADYKTSANLPPSTRDGDFHQQMGLYQLAVMQSYAGQFERIEQVQYFLAHDRAVRREMSEDELDEFVAELKNAVAGIYHAARHDDFPTREAYYCTFCEFEGLCPAKRHRHLLDEEVGEEAEQERATAEVAVDVARRFIDCKRRLAAIKEEEKALREDVIKVARDLAVNKLQASSGEVSISIRHSEKLITKTADPAVFSHLVATVRELGLDEYMTPDTRALTNDLTKKAVLPETVAERLREFLVPDDRESIRVRFADTDEEEQ